MQRLAKLKSVVKEKSVMKALSNSHSAKRELTAQEENTPTIAPTVQSDSDQSVDVPKPFCKSVIELLKSKKPRFKSFEQCFSSSRADLS